MFGFGPASGVLGRNGIERGRLGFDVADFGNGGSESSSDVSPGINNATTFWTSWVFCKCIRFWRAIPWAELCTHVNTKPVRRRCVCDYVNSQISNILNRAMSISYKSNGTENIPRSQWHGFS